MGDIGAAKPRQIKRLESFKDGKVSFSLKPTCLRSLCENLEIIFQDKLEVKNIILNYKEVSDVMVMADPISLLSCVLSNLVSNSIKFSNENSVITIKTKKVGEGKVVILCEDHGVGIPSIKLDKIFTMEEKTTTLGTMGETGTGYGLPIAREIIKLHGGDISIVSQVEGDDIGTVASFELNVA